jgi:tetratricopeptide (TPR) repeat protein
MGIVYEAFDEERRTPVALKALNRFDGAALARFKREFRSLQGLSHPNLVALDELFFEDGRWFFTMELLEGIDFITHVTGAPPVVHVPSTVRVGEHPSSLRPPPLVSETKRASVDQEKLRGALAQLLEGLAVLHAADRVHRDVKPSNVLVTREGRVVLLDFGLVTQVSDERSTGSAVLGTPAYMAPEQAASGAVGPPADMYAVGVILYEALTGRLPIDGPQLQILIEKQTREAARPSAIAAGVPEDLDELCVRLLRFEPARRPTARDILGASARSPGERAQLRTRTSTEAPTFVGRDAELGELRAAFEARTGAGFVTALVCGESGIGKSYTVRRFTGQVAAEHPDAIILEARCYEREAVPYKTLDGIVDALSQRMCRMSQDRVLAMLPLRAELLAHVFPAMVRVPQIAKARSSRAIGLEPHELRRRAFLALRELLARIASTCPAVIVIDDLQWADEDGIRALAEILQPPDAPPLLLVGTARLTPGSDDAELDRLRSRLPGEVRTLALGSLSLEESLQLAQTLLQRLDAPDAEFARIASEARGHPLFVEELARHVSLGAAAGRDVKLDGAIVSRIAQLDERAQRVAHLVALAGRPTPQEVVSAASRAEPPDFARRVATLRASNIVRTGGGRGVDTIEPYHDRVREALVARLDAEERRALHEALALAFEGSPHADPETLARHWMDAGDVVRAAKHAEAAAERAQAAFGFARAAEWFHRALEWSQGGAAARGVLRVKAGDALAKAGRGVDAARYYQAAAAQSPPMQALDLRRRAAEALLSAGRFEEGDAVLQEVLGAVGIRLPRSALVALAGLLFFRFLVLLRGLRFRERTEDAVTALAVTRVEACKGVGRTLALVDNIRGSYFQTRALLAALALGEPNRIAYALAVEGCYLAAAGNGGRSARLLEQAAAIAGRSGDVALGAWVESCVGLSNFCLGRLEDALLHCDRAAATLREGGRDAWWELRSVELSAMWTLAYTGNLEELSQRVERGMYEARDRGDTFAATTLRIGILNIAWLRGGDSVAARAMVVDAMKEWTQRGYHSQHYWHLVGLARIDLYERKGRDAYDRVAADWPRIVRSMLPRIQVMGAEARHLRATAALAAAREAAGSERARLVRVAEGDAARLLSMNWPFAAVLGRIVRAGAWSVRGDDAGAARELEAASGEARALSMGLHGAAARWHLGRLRAGDEGKALVGAAESWMVAQGIADPGAVAGMLAGGFARA